MDPMYAVLAIVATFIVLTLIIAKVERLAFLAPASTRGIRASAQVFCTDRCRSEGRCPLTGTALRAANCPLWRYVDADFPTVLQGSPFEAEWREEKPVAPSMPGTR